MHCSTRDMNRFEVTLALFPVTPIRDVFFLKKGSKLLPGNEEVTSTISLASVVWRQEGWGWNQKANIRAQSPEG